MPLIFSSDDSGPGPLPDDFTRQRAQLGEFQREQIDFQFGNLALEERVVEQRLAFVQFGLGDALDAFDTAL